MSPVPPAPDGPPYRPAGPAPRRPAEPLGRETRYGAAPGRAAASGQERTQVMGMPTGGYRRRREAEETEVLATGPRRRRRQPAEGVTREGRGAPGGPAGPRGPQGPGGRGPRDPRDFAEDGKPRRSGWKRFLPSWKLVVAGLTIVAAGMFGMIVVAYMNTPLPSEKDAQESATAQGSVFYYRDGTPIARLGTKRIAIKLEQVPQHVRDAVIAAENRSFYEDSGIDFTAILRSVWMTVTGQQVQGGSTITQQMARNYFNALSKEQTIKRKIREIFIAIKLDKEWSKDKVLEYYLNTVPFGRNTYGIEAAAREFFKVSAKDLTVAQGAYLAGRIQQPGNFDRYEANNNFAPTRERFEYVIKGMAEMTDENGKPKYPNITATAKFPKPRPQVVSEQFGGLRGYMLTEAIKELAKRGISREQIETGGYKIYTTFDKRLMQIARKAVLATTRTMSKEFHAGLAAVDPTNGRVLAFYGGEDYIKDPWNEPFDSKKQAASAFKPYVLAAWLEAGYSLNSWVPGDKTVPDPLPGTLPIGNSHKVPAAIDVIHATADSVNTAFASMAYKLDADAGTIGQLKAVKDIAIEAGLDPKRMEDDIKEHKYQFSIGSALVTPVEQAAGYSIFANEGKHVDYHVIREVRQGSTVVLKEKKEVKQVISPEAAADAVAALEKVLTEGTAAGKGIGRPAAGKTGTNNDEKEAWFVGFTPQLSVAVGMYREQCRTKSGKIVQPKFAGSCPKGSVAREVSLGFEGAGPPTTIWRTFMMEALAGQPVKQFPPKAGIGTPQNIVPSPTPTPKPTPTEEFPYEDFPDIVQGDDEQECQPGEPGCGPVEDPGRHELDIGGGPNGGDGSQQIPLGLGPPASAPTGGVRRTTVG
ncbi:MAG: transglycosylase domain-containing protein [Actinomycetales bacterium]